MRRFILAVFTLFVMSTVLAAPGRTNHVPDFADGTGTQLDPYRNWTDALAADTTALFTPGWYELPSAGAGNIPNGARLRCEGATIVWPASRTSDSAGFVIPSSATNIIIEGCMFDPGRTVNPINGHSDGGGTYITVGDFGSQTPIRVTIDNNKFGPGILNTNLFWQHIYVRGAVDGLRISRNQFEFADRAIDFDPGSDSLPSWTYNNVIATENLFSYSAAKGTAEDRWWHYFGSPFTYRSNVAFMKNISFTNNVMSGKGAMGPRITRGFENVLIANNVITAKRFDIIYTFGAQDTAQVLRGTNLVVTGNSCGGEIAICDISPWRIDTVTVSGNSLTQHDNDANHTPINVYQSTSVSVTGNTVRWVLPPPDGGGAVMQVGASTGVTVTGNSFVDPPPYGLWVAGTTVALLVSGNLFTNTGSDGTKLVNGAIYFYAGASCTDCIFLNNIVSDISGGTPMFGGTVPAGITDIGNMGGARGFDNYQVDAEITFGDMAGVRASDLQIVPYTLELPVIPGSADGQVLTYKATTGRSYWLYPGWVEDIYSATFCKETSDACNDLHDRYAYAVAGPPPAPGLTAQQVFTFSPGTRSGVLQGWFGTGHCPGCNCVNTEVYLQYDPACTSPPSCSWTTIATFSGDQRYEHYASIPITNQDMSKLAARLYVDAGGGGGKCQGQLWELSVSDATQTLRFPQKDFNGDGMADRSIPIYVEEAGQGIIFTSPDGSCSKCTVNNSDAFACVSVTCP